MSLEQFKIKRFDWNPLEYEELDDYKIDGKRYYVTKDGDMPSMTTLLSVLDDGGIESWRQHVGEKKADEITEDASKRGNSLHDLSEDYLNNKFSSMAQIKGKGALLFKRAKPYLDQIELVLGTEVPVYNAELGYAGRVDAIGYRKGKLSTIDHKNARKAFNLKKAYMRRKLFKYYLQTVGYTLAIEKCFGIRPEKGMVIASDIEKFRCNPFHLSIDDYVSEFEKLIDIYNGRVDPMESMFYQIKD